jgi:1-acyl-sn-glycerol-3-phosphate acyltransferase
VTKFTKSHNKYVRNSLKSDDYFGFDLHSIARLEPVLRFLYKHWWKVEFSGIERLPEEGPVLIAGNTNGLVPWPALMLLYALMTNKKHSRQVHIVSDTDWIDDERIHAALLELGFVPWSSANLKRIFAKGEVAAIFPEGQSAMSKPFAERYRVRDFDWTKFLPAIEEGIPIFPLATLGCDESVPTIENLDEMATFLRIPAYPVSPFFPWLPFPFNMMSLPVKWQMHLLKPTPYKTSSNRDTLEETAKSHARFVEGEVQAELNRMLRLRTRSV